MKRFIYYEEPTITKRLQSAFIKDITGGDELPARGLYTANTTNKICGTFCLNTNYEPEFTETGPAMQKRIFICNWKSKFVDDPKLVDEKKNIYLADKNIGKPDWIKDYGSTFFHILCDYYGKYLKDGERFKLSEEQKQNNHDVLRASDHFRIWFDGIVTKTDNKNDFITFDDLAMELTKSQFWDAKPKNQKTMGSLEYFKKTIKNYKEIMINYRKEKSLRRKKGETQKKIYGGVLVNYKFKEKNDSDFYPENNENNQMDIDSESEEHRNDENINISNKKKKNRKRRLKSKSTSPIENDFEGSQQKKRRIFE